MKKIILFCGIFLMLAASSGINAQLFNSYNTYVIKTVVPVASGSFAVGDTVLWAGIPAADAVRTKSDGIYPFIQSSYDVTNSQFLWTIQSTLAGGAYTYTFTNKLNGLINFWANATQSMYLGKPIGSYPISFTVTATTDANGKACYNVLGPNNIYLSDTIDARAGNSLGCMNTTTVANPTAPFPSIYIQQAPGTGYPADFITAYTNLVPGGATDLTNVTGSLILPTVSGNAAITWVSSNPSVISTTGVVTQPAKYDAISVLTATLTETVNGVTYTLTKTFNVTVKAVTTVGNQLAEWNFATDNIALVNGAIQVKDVQNGFVGTLMNDARIRTIGSIPADQFNVLDLGNGTGYFDMGTEIGKAIYSLTDYTMCGYFYINNNYQQLSNNGNFYWTFSNSTDENTDQNGYIIGSLKWQGQDITPTYWNSGNDQSVGVGPAAPKGAWHHFAYTQSGTTGSIYIDGQLAKTGNVTELPATTLPIAGRTGTLYNWLGRPNFIDNAYLRQTLLYDFQVLNVALGADDFAQGYGDGSTAVDGVPDMLDRLTNAYAEDSDYSAPELTKEMNNLELGDLSAVKENINLPTTGTLDPTIAIVWRSTTPSLIASNGVVTRPKFYNYNDTLIATLTKNGQSLTKSFPATVVVKDGTVFQNDLLVDYDFSKVTSDSIVTDVAEQHVQGVLKNNAKVQSMGSTVKFNVLNLGDSIGYFDMGTDVGQFIYHLNDFTIGAYYRIDDAYPDMTKNGNILWSFCDTKNIEINPIGYIVGNLKSQAETISLSNSGGEQTVKAGTPALQGDWHHFAYTQRDTTGTVYIDGQNMGSAPVKLLPSSLTRAGQLGILYNWIGHSCYASDVYLRQTLVYDFRLYRTALTDDQIMNTLNVGPTISALENAYTEGFNAVKPIVDSRYRILSSVGEIQIQGLTGSEHVSVYDIAGSQLKMISPSLIVVKSGVYIVKINNYITKVIVK